MKLASCPRCERHVAVDASSCPFCHVRLGTTSGLARAAMVAAVGLSMSSCTGNDDTGDHGGSAYAGPGPGTFDSSGGEVTSSSGTTGGAEDSSSGSSSSSTGDGSSSSGTTSAGGSDSGGADYAGPSTG